MQAGAAPKEPPHAVTRAFPYASSLDVAERPKRPQLLRGQLDFTGWREKLRQGQVGVELLLQEGGVLLHQVGPFFVHAPQSHRVVPEVVLGGVNRQGTAPRSHLQGEESGRISVVRTANLRLYEDEIGSVEEPHLLPGEQVRLLSYLDSSLPMLAARAGRRRCVPLSGF